MESVHYLLMKAHTRLNQTILSQASEIGLTAGQPKILEYLMTHEGSDQKTISQYCEIRQSTVGSILLGMEKHGLIKRKQIEGNRRSLYVFLTDKGRQAATDMAFIFDTCEHDALKYLTTDEIEQLKTLLNKICMKFETDRKE